MKTCFIGNSHLGPLMAAARSLPPESRENQRFVIERSTGSVPLRLEGRSGAEEVPWLLLDEQPERSAPVFLDEWEVMTIVGLRFGLIGFETLLQEAQPDADASDSDLPLMSDAAFNELADSFFDSSKALRIIRMLQDLGAPTIHLVPQPLPMEWVASRSGDQFAVWRHVHDQGLSPWLKQQFDRQIERVEAMGVTVFPQPPSTTPDGFFTFNSLGKGQPGDPLFERGDYFHASHRYGELLLEAYLPQAEASLSGTD